MHYPSQTPGRVVSCENEQSYRVYMTSKLIFISEWRSRSGIDTGVNMQRFDSLRYDILSYYHVDEYRATTGNRSELVPEWKSRRYQSILGTGFKLSLQAHILIPLKET